MKNNTNRLAATFFLFIFLLFINSLVFAAPIRGIYITQGTLEDTDYINYLIKNAKNVGINTFIIDMERPSKQFAKNIELVKQNNIRYVARVVMFPGGGTHEQITSKEYWQKRLKLVDVAINYGAQEIQLDYIRYNTKSGSSSDHAKNVFKVIKWFKEHIAQKNVPLQIDVFGVASFGEEKHIGQNIPLFAQTVDTVCPMVYPSHYSPFKQHFATPYETVYDSLIALQDQFDNKVPVKVVAYIELSNYHYLLSHSKKIAYIKAQMKAVDDAKADGWYAWSPNNHYDTLFEILGNTTS